MDTCIFCKIIKKELPANILWENENFIAFLDIYPKTPGHTLVVPKNHEDYVFDLDDETYKSFFKVAKDIAIPLKRALNSKRIGILVEGFQVPHTHIHLVPISNPSELDRKSEKANLDELNRIHEKILKEIN